MKNLLRLIYRNSIYLLYGRGLSLLNKLSLKTKKRYSHGTLSFFGRKFQYTDASSFVSTYEEIFIKNIYLFNCITDRPYVIDCGANVGLSVINFKRQYPQARIKAFEPDVLIGAIVKRNIEAQKYSDIEVIAKAVWIYDGEILFNEQGGLSGSIVDNEGVGTTVVKLACIRLKDLLVEKVDFLKMDIEGAEYKVLLDCKDNLTCVDKMFVEYHSHVSKPQELDKVLQIITNAGFRYHIQEAYTSPQPFVKINTMLDMDLQLNIFCYRK